MEQNNYIKCSNNETDNKSRKVYALTSNGKALLDYTVCAFITICKIIGAEGVQPHTEMKNVQVYAAFSSK